MSRKLRIVLSRKSDESMITIVGQTAFPIVEQNRVDESMVANCGMDEEPAETFAPN